MLSPPKQPNVTKFFESVPVPRWRCGTGVNKFDGGHFDFFFFFLVLGSVPPRGDFLASQQGSLTKVIFFFVGCRAGNKLTGQTSDKRTPTRWRCQPADSGDAPMAGGGRHGRRGEQANNIRVQVFALVKQPKNNIGTFRGRKIKIFLWGPKKGANGWRQLTHNSLCS